MTAYRKFRKWNTGTGHQYFRFCRPFIFLTCDSKHTHIFFWPCNLLLTHQFISSPYFPFLLWICVYSKLLYLILWTTERVPCWRLERAPRWSILERAPRWSILERVPRWSILERVPIQGRLLRCEHSSSTIKLQI